MIPMPDSYTVRLIDMPVRQGGMISEDPDGHINVYLNARLSNVGQMDAAYHEWKHWLDDDLNNGKGIREVENDDRAGRSKRLPKLKRARDLMPKPKIRLNPFSGLEDDVYLRMKCWDE